MQLHPRENYTITRQLQNPFITDTFYVRAVIRNAKTDATIATLDLTDKGGQRFTKQWNVPADPSGQGFYVSIVTSVYEDSGYTTKSQNYGDEENTYLIQERYVFNPNYPSGGSADIDYKRIKKMIDEAVDKLAKKVESRKPEVVEVVKEIVKEVMVPVTEVKVVTQEVIKEVRVPEIKVIEHKVNLGPILNEINKINDRIENLTSESKEDEDEDEDEDDSDEKESVSTDKRTSRLMGVASPFDHRVNKIMKL